MIFPRVSSRPRVRIDAASHRGTGGGAGKTKRKTKNKTGGDDADKKPKKRRTSGDAKLVPDLDLSGRGGKEALRKVYAQFKPITNQERILIFMHYLTEELGVSSLNADHVFTCYRHVPGLKAPLAMRQSLIDTASRKSWLDTSDMDDIAVTTAGINYLEHDMPKADPAE
ncbi:MAG: hypothetical protein IH898_08035 [Planctomycetes bacterium]|nr:hypothetical protein [Planctomycetota bacterium]